MNSANAGNAGKSAGTSTTPPQPPPRLDPSGGLSKSELEQAGKGRDGKPLPEPRYITVEGEKEVLLQREEFVLRKRGSITFGTPLVKAAEGVEFDVE